MLIERVNRHHVDVWCEHQDGWVVLRRGRADVDRAHARHRGAVLQGDLRGGSTHVDPIFGLHIPNGFPACRVRCSTPRQLAEPGGYDREL